MLYVGYATGRRIATLRLGVGSVLPMMATAIGLAYVWELPAGEQRRLLALARQESGPDWERIDRRVRTAFADLESIGTCFSVSGYQRDAFGIALPIRVGRQRIPMALSCGAVEIESRRDAARTRIAPELKKAAPQLEKILADVEDPV